MNTSASNGDYRQSQTPAADPDFDQDAELSLAELRIDEAVSRRRRERWLDDRRREATTLASALAVSHLERVTLHLLDGSTLAGTVVEVGADYVALDAGDGVVWLTLAALGAANIPTGKVCDPAEQAAPSSMLVDVVEDLMASEVRIEVTISGGVTLRGEIASVGGSLRLSRPHDDYESVIEMTAIAKLRAVD